MTDPTTETTTDEPFSSNKRMQNDRQKKIKSLQG